MLRCVEIDTIKSAESSGRGSLAMIYVVLIFPIDHLFAAATTPVSEADKPVSTSIVSMR